MFHEGIEQLLFEHQIGFPFFKVADLVLEPTIFFLIVRIRRDLIKSFDLFFERLNRADKVGF